MPPQHVTQSIEAADDVSKPDPTGRQRITTVLRRIRQQIEMGEVSRSYDSTGPPVEQDPDLVAVFAPMIGWRLVATIDPGGNVLAAEGAEAIWDHLRAESPAARRLLEKAQAVASGCLGYRFIGQTARMLPSGPVAVGDEWLVEFKTAMPFVGTVAWKATCRLQELAVGTMSPVAVVAYTGTLETSNGSKGQPGLEGLKVMGIQLTQEGHVLIDVKTGLPIEGTSRQFGMINATMQYPDGRALKLTCRQEVKTRWLFEPESQAATKPAEGSTR